MDEHEFHVVLSDQRMPRISGVEFFELIMPDHPDVSRVLVTGYADTDMTFQRKPSFRALSAV